MLSGTVPLAWERWDLGEQCRSLLSQHAHGESSASELTSVVMWPEAISLQLRPRAF